jgi:hypothetical protein
MLRNSIKLGDMGNALKALTSFMHGFYGYLIGSRRTDDHSRRAHDMA